MRRGFGDAGFLEPGWVSLTYFCPESGDFVPDQIVLNEAKAGGRVSRRVEADGEVDVFRPMSGHVDFPHLHRPCLQRALQV